MFQPTPTCLSVGDSMSTFAARHARMFQPTPTCLSVGDLRVAIPRAPASDVSTHAHLSVGGRRRRPRLPHRQPVVSTHAHLSVGGRLTDGQIMVRLPEFQPTPTCLSVGDEEGGGDGAGGEVVSTHAHLSVGGRLVRTAQCRRVGAFQPTPTCLSVGDPTSRPARRPSSSFNPRPPVCRWATRHLHAEPPDLAVFQPTPTCLSVGDPAPTWGLFPEVRFQPTPTCLSVGDPQIHGDRDSLFRVSTHAHLSVGGRPPRARAASSTRTGFNPRPPVCRWATCRRTSRRRA